MGEFRPVKNILKASTMLMIPRALYRGVILYFTWLWFAIPLGYGPLNFWIATVIGGTISIITFEHIGETHTISGAFTKMIEWVIGSSVWFLFAFLIHLGFVYHAVS